MSLQKQRLFRTIAAGAGLSMGLLSGVLQQWPNETRDLSSFHLGELFATNVYMTSDQTTSLPMTIHGALNYLPASLMQVIFDGPSHTYATIIFFVALAVAAQVIFILLIERLLPKGRTLLAFMFVVGLITSQTVHYRDLGLLLAVYFFYLAMTRSQGRQQIFLILLTGSLTYVSLVWSWNRGIPGLVGISIALLILGLPRGQRRYWLGLASMVVTGVVLALVSPILRFETIFENLFLLLSVSETTRYPWDFAGLKTIAGLSLLFISSILALGIFVFRPKVTTKTLAQGVLWLTILVATIRIALDRFDWLHMMPSLWVMLAIWVVCAPAVVVVVPRKWQLIGVGLILALLWLLLGPSQPQVVQLTALAIVSFAVLRPLNQMTIVWSLLAVVVVTAQLSISKQSLLLWEPRDLVERFSLGPELSDDQRWLIERVKDQSCLVDVTNRGLINQLTGIPSCFRYGALLWVPNSKQEELISVIKSKSPDVIVWSENSSPSFEGMQDLTDWIKSNYPVIECSGGECVRVRSATTN